MKDSLRTTLAILAVALAILPRAQADDPGSRESKAQAAAVNTQLAVAYMRENNLAAAKEKIDKALLQNAGTADTQMAAGFIYDRLGDGLRALKHYEQAAKLAKDNPDVLQNVGVYFCRTGNYERGEQLLLQTAQNALYLTPAVAYTNAGRCAREGSRPADAEQHFRQALAINPRQADALLQMAELTQASGSGLQARAFLERYTAVAPATPATLWLGRNIELGLGDKNEAAKYSQRLKQEFPDAVETGKLYDAEHAKP